MTEDDILAAHYPEAIFCVGSKPTEDAVKEEYRLLAKAWHPDHHKTANPAVFAHLGELYREALHRVKLGVWGEGRILRIISGHRDLTVMYRKKRPFEFGNMYLGNKTIVYEFDRAEPGLVYDVNSSWFIYADDAMRQKFQHLFPIVREKIIADDKRSYLFINKNEDQLCLADVIDHYNGKVPQAHAAWIVSRLLNIACYLKYRGIAHLAIQPENLLISPPMHTVALMGGWWFSRKFGEPVSVVPQDTALVASDLLRPKRAVAAVDLECIRAVARRMLGGNAAYVAPDAAHVAFVRWCQGASSGDALEDFQKWQNAVLPAMGPRKFVDMLLTARELYS